MARTFICPYCFETSKKASIHFRCGNAHCHHEEPDRNLHFYRLSYNDRAAFIAAEDFDRNNGNPQGTSIRGGSGYIKAPPFIIPDQRKINWFTPSSAICPNCEKVTRKAICPICHNDLPQSTLQGNDILIAIIGMRSAGKSVYIGTIIHELLNVVLPAYNISVSAASVRVRNIYNEVYGCLYDRAHPTVPARTDTALVQVKEGTYSPLMYTVELPNGKQRNIVFFDAAGEDLENGLENMEKVCGYIANPAGIISLVDPLRIGDIVYSIEETKREAHGFVKIEPDQDLGKIHEYAYDMIRQNNHNARRKVGVPFAVVLTKLDAIHPSDRLLVETRIIQKDSRIIETSPHRIIRNGIAEFDEGDLEQVSADVRDVLVEKNNAFITNLEAQFSNCRYFAVSSIGLDNSIDVSTENEEPATLITSPQPHRIEDPVLWILKENGLIGRPSSRDSHSHMHSTVKDFFKRTLEHIQQITDSIKQASKHRIARLALIVIALVAVLGIIGFVLIRTSNGDENAAAEIKVIKITPDVNLIGEETIYAEIEVTRAFPRGEHMISYSLQLTDRGELGEVVLADSGEYHISYQRYGSGGRLELFTFSFQELKDYVLEVHINDVFLHRAMLHGA